jgi:hypothetical protein
MRRAKQMVASSAALGRKRTQIDFDHLKDRRRAAARRHRRFFAVAPADTVALFESD